MRHGKQIRLALLVFVAAGFVACHAAMAQNISETPAPMGKCSPDHLIANVPGGGHLHCEKGIWISGLPGEFGQSFIDVKVWHRVHGKKVLVYQVAGSVIEGTITPFLLTESRGTAVIYSERILIAGMGNDRYRVHYTWKQPESATVPEQVDWEGDLTLALRKPQTFDLDQSYSLEVTRTS